jgi:hypothetical protein
MSEGFRRNLSSAVEIVPESQQWKICSSSLMKKNLQRQFKNIDDEALDDEAEKQAGKDAI